MSQLGFLLMSSLFGHSLSPPPPISLRNPATPVHIHRDKHAGVSQLGFLLMGIFAAAFYKQAPMRPVREPKLSDNLGRAEAPPVKGGGA